MSVILEGTGEIWPIFVDESHNQNHSQGTCPVPRFCSILFSYAALVIVANGKLVY